MYYYYYYYYHYFLQNKFPNCCPKLECLATIIHKNNGTHDKFYRKVAFLTYTKVLNLGLKAEKPLRNENHTEDWALRY